MADEDDLRSTLLAVADLARSAAEKLDGGRGATGNGHRPEEPLTCTPRALPDRLLVAAAQTAARVNPMNSPVVSGSASAVGASTDAVEPLRIAVMTSKYWRPVPRTLTVSFLEAADADLRARILEHMNAWATRGCIRFAETAVDGEVRISREGDGFWSFLGTDILHVPAGRPTLNLEGFTMATPESEYKRVVRHEAGHTLGFPHEHMRRELIARIDREKAYLFFARTQGWSRAMVDAQVLTPLDDADLIATRSDENSIMCYQLPGSITLDGRPILGGLDIDETDFSFVEMVYPPTPAPGSVAVLSTLPTPRAAAPADELWPTTEDVLVPMSS
ncbi:M12 family metallopeptidase [Actinomycetospora sp. TBRC 11914]|uniref:M12 family metallopeptidase n=1 Tax=Actinomycetospora sp. TBRC 11914 TaxID=2729387 RepID=UPI00145D5490|nr:M12 family metallopeptidase [Actinomycetospora sp. TBRC 11914]NMO89522.1 peptidase M12 [Actinomycetospora sp. TBRC 11914]